MKREPPAGEPALTHVEKYMGQTRTFALADENYDPQPLDKLDRALALPSVPDLPEWRVGITLQTKTLMVFSVLVRGVVASWNCVWPEGDSVEVQSACEAGSLKLSREELDKLADLGECVAVALFRRGTNASRNVGRRSS
jgi:hypothetical protein